MIKWLRKKLGIDTIVKSISENNTTTKNKLIEIGKSIESLNPKKENEVVVAADSFNLKNEISNLNFKLSNNINLDKNWLLITTQDSKSNFLSQIAGTSSIGGAAAYSANGLYTATVNTSSLMTYGNGSLSSITMNGSKFGSHAGFVSANPAVFTPILAVQFASMLTGQYYFNGLTKQLNSVQKGINELISLHHNQRLAKLQYINIKINELNNRNFFTTEDYVIVDRLKYDLSIIRFEYLLSAQQEIINTFEKIKNPEKNEITNHIIPEDSNRVEKTLISIKNNAQKISSFISSTYKKTGIDNSLNYLKSKTENSNQKVQELAKKVDESKFFFYSYIALKSEQLYQLIKLFELKINLSDKTPNTNRIGKIEELYKSIIEFNNEDSIYNEMKQLITELKKTLLSEIEIHRNNSQISKSKIDLKTAEILEKFTTLENNLNDRNLIYEDIKRIKTGFETSHQILIDNRAETTRIYTKTITKEETQ
ncbi:hypothetical protein [Flavobacterium sp.]|uniref:hypothetical protein n=1 Tax=Flavobacterium sp. TaxID=239 RepID=UPI003A9225C5